MYKDIVDNLIAQIKPMNSAALSASEVVFAALQPSEQPYEFLSRSSTADDIDKIVVDAYRRGDDWEAGLATAYKRSGTFARRRATQNFVNAAGGQIPDGYRLGEWAFQSKEAMAIAAARNSRQKFNEALPRLVKRVRQSWFEEKGSYKGLNRQTIAARLRSVLQRGDDVYVPARAALETGRQYDQMIHELCAANGVDPYVVILPETFDERCRHGCPEMAGQTYLLSEAPEMPRHFGCFHHKEIKKFDFGVPVVDLGAENSYMLKDLRVAQ